MSVCYRITISQKCPTFRVLKQNKTKHPLIFRDKNDTEAFATFSWFQFIVCIFYMKCNCSVLKWNFSITRVITTTIRANKYIKQL